MAEFEVLRVYLTDKIKQTTNITNTENTFIHLFIGSQPARPWTTHTHTLKITTGHKQQQSVHKNCSLAVTVFNQRYHIHPVMVKKKYTWDRRKKITKLQCL